MKDFFLITPPGLEALAKQELEQIWSLISDSELETIKQEHGGIEFTLPFEDALKLNYYLSIPTRLLLRLDSFKCRDFPKLFKKLQKLNWRDYLRGQIPQVQSSSHDSRLFDSRRIEKTFQDAIKKYYQANPAKKEFLESLDKLPPQNIYLRFENDLCTISLDTSGERLDRRGYKLAITQAPLRESLAAAMIQHTLNNLGDSKDLIFIDPMSGSGSLVFESLRLGQAHTYRPYAFEFFPCYKPQKLNLPHLANPISTAIGLDYEESALKASALNLDHPLFKGKNIAFKKADLFLDRPKVEEGKRVILLNPPYNKRLKTPHDLKLYYEGLLKRMIEVYSPYAFGALVPQEKYNFSFPQYKSHTPLCFENGGLKVAFFLFTQ